MDFCVKIADSFPKLQESIDVKVEPRIKGLKIDRCFIPIKAISIRLFMIPKAVFIAAYFFLWFRSSLVLKNLSCVNSDDFSEKYKTKDQLAKADKSIVSETFELK